ncbi:MAG: hypothetical protein LBR54_00750 [Oscillospiraceae bacterium]|jgi:hypothetical protein|nr:hypothetical protein [Oscillospiraceae bacterium]
MYTRRILAGIMAFTVVAAAFAACKEDPPPVAETTPVPETSAPATSATPPPNLPEPYKEAMKSYISAFDSVLEKLNVLADGARSMEKGKEFQDWAKDYTLTEDYIKSATAQLAKMQIPKEAADIHRDVTVATAAVYNAMAKFEEYVNNAAEGDDADFETGLDAFLKDMKLTRKIWKDAKDATGFAHEITKPAANSSGSSGSQ